MSTNSYPSPRCSECNIILSPHDPAPLCDECETCARVEASEYTPKRIDTPHKGNLHELRGLISDFGGEARVQALLQAQGIL